MKRDPQSSRFSTMSLPQPTTPPQKHVFLPVSPSRSSFAFCFIALHGAEVTDDLLDKCAKVFSANYGVWGDLAGPLAGIIHFSVVLEHVLTPLREKGQNVWCPTKKTMPLDP